MSSSAAYRTAREWALAPARLLLAVAALALLPAEAPAQDTLSIRVTSDVSRPENRCPAASTSKPIRVEVDNLDTPASGRTEWFTFRLWAYRAGGDITVVLSPLGETFGRVDIEASWSELQRGEVPFYTTMRDARFASPPAAT